MLVRRVILLLPLLLLLLPTQKDTLVSFNRVIIVASGPISRLILCLGKEIPIIAKEEKKKKKKKQKESYILVRRVIMLIAMLVLLANTKKHILVSFNRVIIVASGPISRIILFVGSLDSIDAKEQRKQEQK